MKFKDGSIYKGPMKEGEKETKKAGSNAYATGVHISETG